MLRRFDLTPPRVLLALVLLAFFAAFLVYPLGYVFVNAFFPEGRLSFYYFELLVTDEAQWQLVLNSFLLGLATTAATTLVALPMAYAMVRCEFPGKGLLGGLLLVPMVMPPFVGAVGMKRMLARYGSVNLLLQKIGILGAEQYVDWFAGGGMLGVVILEVLHLYPIMYLNVAAALANIDPSLEEAARNAGASGFRLFRRITFPLMLPGYFAGATIVFIWAFTDLGTPLVFGYTRVVPVRIFNLLDAAQEDPMGYTLVVFLLALTVVFFTLSKRVGGTRRYEMIARGHVASPACPVSAPVAAGIWAGLLAVVALALLPHVSVVLTSVARAWTGTVLPTEYTLEHFRTIWTHDVAMPSIKTSFLLSAMSTLADILLGIGIAWLLTRTRMPGRTALDVLAMLPLAVPGVVLAFGYVMGFSGTPLSATANPLPILVIAYAVRRLPYMVRSAYAGLQQTSVTLEEAAQNVGAGPVRTLVRITLPLVLANLVAGAILCFSFAMLEVSDSLILARQKAHYPITKAIWHLLGRPDGEYVASALGVLGMVLLAGSLLVAGKVLGRRMGELFRA